MSKKKLQTIDAIEITLNNRQRMDHAYYDPNVDAIVSNFGVRVDHQIRQVERREKRKKLRAALKG